MLVKKAVAVFVIMLFCVVFAYAAPDVSADSAVVINAETKEVVFEKNARQKRSMASTTKIMTAVIALESGKILENVSVTSEMTGAQGTSIGLKAGYEIQLLDLLYGMMLESGNDAADAVSVFIGGSQEGFAKLMNSKAATLGMTDTNFVTPSGLDDENHYTTAYDMALLGAYALENPLFREICSAKSKTVSFIEPDINMTFSNHNRLLSSYDGTIGIKTGFTKKSGRCLVSAAERDGVCFVCVTLNASDDWNDHKKLLDYAFEGVKKKSAECLFPEQISVQGGNAGKISLELQRDAEIFYNGECGDITAQIFLPQFVYAPVSAGDVIGKVVLTENGKVLSQIDIVASQSVAAVEESYTPKKSFFEKIKEKLGLLSE